MIDFDGLMAAGTFLIALLAYIDSREKQKK